MQQILKLTSSSESIHQKFIDVEIHAPRADVVDDDDEVMIMNKNNCPVIRGHSYYQRNISQSRSSVLRSSERKHGVICCGL